MSSQTGTYTATEGKVMLAAASCLGVIVALALLMTAHQSLGSTLALLIGAAFLFNAISNIVRWLVTKSNGRVLLLSRYPVALGLMKLAGVATVLSLALLTLVGYFVGAAFGKLAISALVRGVIAFAVLSMVANGLLNALIVVRYLRGTLATTSRERSP